VTSSFYIALLKLTDENRRVLTEFDVSSLSRANTWWFRKVKI